MFNSDFVRVILFVCCACISASETLAQDVVAIRGGTLLIENSIGRVDIHGTRGFNLTATVSTNELLGNGVLTSCSPVGCPPEAVAPLLALWFGSDLFNGVVRFKGQTYDGVGGPVADSSARLSVSGAVPLPAESNEPIGVIVPFDFAGIFSYGMESTPTSPVQHVMLVGGGTASFVFEWSDVDLGWYFRRAEFRFTPVVARR